jgi:hypothetical protein
VIPKNCQCILLKLSAILAIVMIASYHWNHLRVFWNMYSLRIFDLLISWKLRQLNFLDFIISIAVSLTELGLLKDEIIFEGLIRHCSDWSALDSKYRISRTMKKRLKFLAFFKVVSISSRRFLKAIKTLLYLELNHFCSKDLHEWLQSNVNIITRISINDEIKSYVRIKHNIGQTFLFSYPL